MAARMPAPPASTRLIVAAGKGGDSKTLTTGGLADALARTGARVLAVDLDSQPTLTTWLVGQAQGPGVAGVLAGRIGVDQAVQEVASYRVGRRTGVLAVLGSTPELAQHEAGDQVRALVRLREQAHVARFHYVLVDTSAWRGTGTSAGLQVAAAAVADRLVMVAEPAAASAWNAEQLLERAEAIGRLRGLDLPVSLQPTKTPRGQVTTASVLGVLRQRVPHAMGPITRTVWAPQAMLAGLPIAQLATDLPLTRRTKPLHDLARDYARSALQLATVLAGDPVVMG